jgi:hypothetical protein
MNNPIKFDAFSCGVYVAWMFIRQASRHIRVGMAANSLPIRRFELFYYLKTGQLLPLQPVTSAGPRGDDTEEKAPPPSQTQDDEEEVTPTQEHAPATQEPPPDTQVDQ